MARNRTSGLAPQTQSSLAVSIDGNNWAVLNASPDIRSQIEHTSVLHPRGLRDSPISSVLVTNGDIDHIAGLLILRDKQTFTVFMTSALAGIIDANPIFQALDPTFVSRHIIALDDHFELLPGLDARIFAVPGKVPLFMENGEPELNVEGEQTVGVELTGAGRRIVYIPGCGFISPVLAERMSGADAIFFDGTVFTDDEMIVTGTGQKTGRRMGHMPISGEDGSLSILRGIDAHRKIYIHINNTNPIWRQGPERIQVETAGVEIGFDGMEVRF